MRQNITQKSNCEGAEVNNIVRNSSYVVCEHSRLL